MSTSSSTHAYEYDASSGHLIRASRDLKQGVTHKLWITLALRDLRDRYHGAALGVLWVVITTSALSIGLALIYSQVFTVELRAFLPYVTIGIATWSLISTLLTDSTQVFITAASYFKQMPIPVSVFVFRMALRNLIFTLLRMLVVLGVLITLQVPFTTTQLYAFAGIVVICIWGVGLGLLLGPISARFRDVGQAIVALTTFAFFVTPVFWYPEKLQQYAFVVNWNPLYHLLEAVRAPILGGDIMVHLPIAGGIALATFIAGFIVFITTKSKLVYWC